MTENSPRIALNLPLEKILLSETTSFQSFVNSLKTSLANFEPTVVSLYAKKSETSSTLIATSDEQLAKQSISVPFLDRAFVTSIDMDVSREGYKFLLLIGSKSAIGATSFFRKLIQSKIEECVSRKKQEIRRLIIEQSVRSQEVNSFLHRVAHALAKNVLFADEISLIIPSPSKAMLQIAGTSCNVRTLKSSLNFKNENASVTSTVYSQNTPVVEIAKPNTEELDEFLGVGLKYNRVWWPISLKHEEFNTVDAKLIAPIGVIRATNIRRRLADLSLRATDFSDYHRLILNFVAEVLFVLVQQYIQYLESRTNLARLTHALGDSVDTIFQYTGDAKKLLFHDPIDPLAEEEEDSAESGKSQENFVWKSEHAHPDKDSLYLFLEDIERHSSDLYFQFYRMQETKTDCQYVENLHSEVLMPFARLRKQLAVMYGRQSIRFNSFKKAGNLGNKAEYPGSLDIPKVWGNPTALVSVFRNLLDNSAKYTYQNIVYVSVSFRVTTDHVFILYHDSGIGIPENRLEDVFIEGFRAENARMAHNKGIGIGLSFCRSVLTDMGGGIKCVPSTDGARFEISLRRQRPT